MKSGITIQPFGTKELINVLNELPKSLGDRILRNINKEGAKVYKEEIRESAPVGNDRLYNAVAIQDDPFNKTAVRVGMGNRGFVARFIEFGTKDRYTKGRGRKRKIKNAYRGKMTAKPFVNPAIERATPRALEIIEDKMGKVVYNTLKKANKKLSKKYGI